MSGYDAMSLHVNHASATVNRSVAGFIQPEGLFARRSQEEARGSLEEWGRVGTLPGRADSRETQFGMSSVGRVLDESRET